MVDTKFLDILFSGLEEEFPDPKIELAYKSGFELLTAVILSAQCTDKRVNSVTESLFKKYSNPKNFAGLSQEELEREIKPCGFYKTKAKNIIKTASIIYDKYQGKIPDDMEILCSLPGIGRKTANVILGALFNKQTIVVDTHVIRVSFRLGLTKSDNPEVIEKDLMKILPEDKWSRTSHQLLLHGRYICKARKPSCSICKLYSICTWSGKILRLPENS